MVTRDPRWENVYAHVLPRNQAVVPFDEEEARLSESLIDFEIGVREGDCVYYLKRIVHKNELHVREVYGHILDLMVKRLEDYMKEQ